MQIDRLDIDCMVRLIAHRSGDARGWLAETWNARRIAEAGLDVDSSRHGCSSSCAAGSLHGLHFQRPPAGQPTLMRRVAARGIDVAVPRNDPESGIRWPFDENGASLATASSGVATP